MAPLDDALVNVTALRSSSRLGLAALRALGDGDLGPFADELQPLLEDADVEDSQLADVAFPCFESVWLLKNRDLLTLVAAKGIKKNRMHIQK